ncbi:MAG: iron-containing alcohol dehydrogenase [Clostridia bacterium]|nr:iron-containing alcohol dehydrogenase [Clostridia bacterium]
MQHVMRGRGCLNRENVASMLDMLSIQRPMLVCGARMSGIFVERTGLKLPVFSGYHPNPDLADCSAGAALFREHGCDGLISVGGGSAMDTAKGVQALLMTDDMEAVRASRLPDGEATPHIAIPGTAGTGAEATPIAVVYVNDEKLSLDHPMLLPSGVLLDGSLLDTLPEYHRKACAMDALAQGIESWWAVKATAESRVHAERAILGVLRNLSAYLDGCADAQDAMLEAAYESGCAIRISRTTAAHAMSYQITKQLGYAHGHACMLTLPWLWMHLDEGGRAQRQLSELSEMMGLQADRMEGPVLLRGLLAGTDMLPDVQINDALLDALAASVNTQRLGNHPEPLSEAELRMIYAQAFAPVSAQERDDLASVWRHYAG